MVRHDLAEHLGGTHELVRIHALVAHDEHMVAREVRVQSLSGLGIDNLFQLDAAHFRTDTVVGERLQDVFHGTPPRSINASSFAAQGRRWRPPRVAVHSHLSAARSSRSSSRLR
jgi:hypothetical protein